ncbi:MAG: DNA (cytosine-5-)-methyltransferase [Leucobacter sp.]|nr:DNA (cytosine-5-)-methyltransferase [Leucobacter sp.]
MEHSVLEICAGAGGQSLGLHRAGFSHSLAIEIDELAAKTLSDNLGIEVSIGDVADPSVWNPADHVGTTLLAGGVPCPPFSVAGKQLGSSDERDLFAWAIEQVAVVRPRAVMLENVRGLAGPRFAGYRQRVLDRLDDLGYVGEWKLLTSADFGVPQLRPRFVLVAMHPEDQNYFHWPEPTVSQHRTVGEVLFEQMAQDGWVHAQDWRELANGVGPTIVGGSKKHGGADLGPTRAKEGWAKLFVDGKGIADAVPAHDDPHPTVKLPRLTIDMVARVQGWKLEDNWQFAGRKTAQYRQIGNAFPPPVAEAVGKQILAALNHVGTIRSDIPSGADLHDPVYRALSQSQEGLTLTELINVFNIDSAVKVQQRLTALRHDFDLVEVHDSHGTTRYKLGEFLGFVGQTDHQRHEFLKNQRQQVS